MEKIGCFNKSADKVKRNDTKWSDTNMEGDYRSNETFNRLMCDCGCKVFEVLNVADYETAAKCNDCGKYFLVHCG